MGLSFGSFLQFAVIGVLGYILAGAPLRSLLSPTPTSERPNVLPFHAKKSLVIPDKDLNCPKHDYTVHLLAREPLVIYIENFLSGDEARHVVEMSEPRFKPSTVWTKGIERLDDKVRKSEKAQLDRDDVVKCIEERARTFQGWQANVFIEKLWSQRYGPSGHYRHHYDWSTSTSTSGRISSFMVYLEANCTGGGTNFPRIKKPNHETWCRFIECGNEDGEEGWDGVTFKPIAHNAVFWENLRSDGSGYTESWHAGLPVKSGTKIGLNIWSWYQKGYTPEA
ncbi:hypothetical protein BDV96DRAFT_503480 [Lophiotrema nucula]|uniref:Prolyl 4-hydroxylase alpha subunit domain-containing protein n=1 Tax=Lophiotrema nucula TaxID=690887 RepID=A0A6A5YPR4_9PLEO|nr:hypothetical protein BDV96DRAFT_503480 [Lophiotrema nucula]